MDCLRVLRGSLFPLCTRTGAQRTQRTTKDTKNKLRFYFSIHYFLRYIFFHFLSCCNNALKSFGKGASMDC